MQHAMARQQSRNAWSRLTQRGVTFGCDMARQSLATNCLKVPLPEFRRAVAPFTPKRLKLGPALLAFENGFLSIESGEVTVVMHATGEWHGRATFSPQTLRALATVPPNQNPLTISYAEGHLLIATMTIACEWHPISEGLIHNLENPSLFDLLVMERTLPRAEIKSTELGRRVTAAAKDAEKRIRKAASQLSDLQVTEAEILALVDSKIKARLHKG